MQAIFEDANLIFQHVDVDIGKDAYVDVAEADRFTGTMVALQIKSGTSYRRGDDYKIPCDADDRALWGGSTIPIYGMVYDPERQTVHWVDLSEWARALPAQENPSYCPVPRENLLNAQTLPFWVARVRARAGRQVSPPVLDLMADDVRRQLAAVSDCFALGRSDPRPLTLLRACLRWLADVDVSWPAIQILSFATPHPDVFWTAETWVPDHVKQALNATYRWSIEEAVFLLAAPAGDMWGRGDLGQCVYMLLAADPCCDELLEDVVASTKDEDVRWQAALIRVTRAGESGLSTLERLAATTPALRNAELFTELHLTLVEHGHVSMW